MRVVLFGASGMLGQGALRECLRTPDVEAVLSMGRRKTGALDPKLEEIVLADLFSLGSVSGQLAGYDVCLYCLGETSVWKTEAAYRRSTVELTISIATVLLRANPGMKMLFISGTGTDSTGTSRQMWARVKGEAENALLGLDFAGAYMFRPAFVQPLNGIQARTVWLRQLYRVLVPLLPLLRGIAPGKVSTTEELGRAMLNVARYGFPKQILENADFRVAAASAGGGPTSP